MKKCNLLIRLIPVIKLTIIVFPLLTIFTTFSCHCLSAEPVDKNPAVTVHPKYARLIPGFRALITAGMEKQQVSGTSLAVFDETGVLWCEAFGFTDRNRETRVTTGTLFNIASMSKTITATAIMLAVQEGRLDLDTPIVKYLPEFNALSRFEKKPGKKITLRHLLSHHAGLTTEPPMGNSYDLNYPSFEKRVRSIYGSRLRCLVGERFKYSNIGIDLAGYILQQVCGQPFPQYVRKKLLEPLNMKHSSFNRAKIKGNPDRATGEDNVIIDVPQEVNGMPSGGFFSNAREMAAFIRFHLNGGKSGNHRLLQLKYMKEMHTMQFNVDGQIKGYCLGIRRWNHAGYHEFYHGGQGPGFTSCMWWIPRYKIGIVILTNSWYQNFHWGAAEKILDGFIDIKTGGGKSRENKGAGKPLPPVITVGPDVQKSLEGHYISDKGLVFEEIQLKKKKVFGMQTAGAFYPLHFYSPDAAYIKKGKTHRHYRFVYGKGKSPPYIIRLEDGFSYDYNYGPNDKPGPDKKQWDNHLGVYWIDCLGVATESVKIHKRNGYLFYQELKLHQLEPGLFSTCIGEVLDLRSIPPTWRNIKLKRSPHK